MRAALLRFDPTPAFVAAAVVILPLAFGREIVQKPSMIRLLVLVVILSVLFITSVSAPRIVIVATFLLLPLLGLARRLLISSTGWPAHDPLVLLGPAVAAILFVRLFVLQSRPLAGDRLSRLILAFLMVVLVESLNPEGGGLSAGAGGFIYVGMPLLWYFVGRELLSSEIVRRLLLLTVGMSCVVALYGLGQYVYGFPSWDAQWLAVAAQGTVYNSLYVGSKIRDFSTFASSAEYASYLAVGFVVAFAFLLKGRFWSLPAIPLLAVATFLDGSRGPVVFALLGVFAIVGLATSSPPKAIFTIAIGIVLAVLALHTYRGSLDSQAATSGNAFVTHQISGLTHPLSQSQSTLLLHYKGVIGGIKEGLSHPLGSGSASISLGGGQLGGAHRSTEFDLSNAFVGLGLVGGVLFTLILFKVAGLVLRVGTNSRGTMAVAACAVVVVSFGQWLNGGFYVVAPLAWLLLGWLVAESRTGAVRAPALSTTRGAT